MSLINRLSYLVRSKLSAVIDSVSDPIENLEYQQKQLKDNVRECKRAITEMDTQINKLKSQRENLMKKVEKRNEQAREAMKAGREELAEKAITEKQELLAQVEDKENAIDEIRPRREDLEDQLEELKSQVKQFETKKANLKARHTAAQSEVKVQEIMTGLDEDSVSLSEIEDEIEETEARAEALDGLDFENEFDDKTALDKEMEELRKETGEDEVTAELEMLKEEVGADANAV